MPLTVPHWINSNLHLLYHVHNLSFTKSWLIASLIMPKFLTFKVSVDSLGADWVDFSVEIHHWCCSVFEFWRGMFAFHHADTYSLTYLENVMHINRKEFLILSLNTLFIITVIIDYVNVMLLLWLWIWLFSPKTGIIVLELELLFSTLPVGDSGHIA